MHTDISFEDMQNGLNGLYQLKSRTARVRLSTARTSATSDIVMHSVISPSFSLLQRPDSRLK
jgi:hypothetical protein